MSWRRLRSGIITITSAEIITVQPTVGTADWAGPAPTEQQDHASLPITGAATWAGPAPTEQQSHVSLPTVGAVAWAGLQPTIDIAIVIEVSPITGAATWAGPTPTEQQDHVSLPAIGAATWAGLQPDVTYIDTRLPLTGAATWAGPAPTVDVAAALTGSNIIERDLDRITDRSGNPIILRLEYVLLAPTTGTADWAGPAPTEKVDIVQSPGTGTADWTGPQPTITVSGVGGEPIGLLLTLTTT